MWAFSVVLGKSSSSIWALSQPPLKTGAERPSFTEFFCLPLKFQKDRPKETSYYAQPICQLAEKLVHCGSGKESFPSRCILPNWEPDMESRWEATMSPKPHPLWPQPSTGFQLLGVNTSFCSLLPSPPTIFIRLLTHSFTNSYRTLWILSIEDTVVSKLQKSLVLLHSTVVLFSMIDNNYMRLFTFKVTNIKF